MAGIGEQGPRWQDRGSGETSGPLAEGMAEIDRRAGDRHSPARAWPIMADHGEGMADLARPRAGIGDP